MYSLRGMYVVRNAYIVSNLHVVAFDKKKILFQYVYFNAKSKQLITVHKVT